MYTQIGILLLIALAAKNAILIVEVAREQRLIHNKTIIEAAVLGAKTRFRPILMTSFAFIMGVMPLVFATGAGANARHSIGIAVCRYAGFNLSCRGFCPRFLCVTANLAGKTAGEEKGKAFNKDTVDLIISNISLSLVVYIKSTTALYIFHMTVTINLKNFESNAEHLRQFFEAQTKLGIKVWFKNQNYRFADGTSFQFKNNVIQRNRKEGKVGVRYELMANEESIGVGTYACAYKIKATLSLNKKSPQVKPRRKDGTGRVVLVQQHSWFNNPLSDLQNAYELAKRGKHLAIKEPTLTLQSIAKIAVLTLFTLAYSVFSQANEAFQSQNVKVEKFNQIIGTQAFQPLYGCGNQCTVPEAARDILELGSRTIKISANDPKI